MAEVNRAVSSDLLTRLSASPASSTSSLTSSESFDPHADPTEIKAPATSTSQVLGLRELARMRRHERRRTKESSRQVEIVGKSNSQVRLVSAVIGAGTDLPFASDVEIKGWRVVGGKSWTDLGRIGAYVGESYPFHSM